jgi:hypothetical protein
MQKAKTLDPDSDHSYPLEFFAQKHELSLRAAKIILYSNGPSRVACDAAALAFLEAMANHRSPASAAARCPGGVGMLPARESEIPQLGFLAVRPADSDVV